MLIALLAMPFPTQSQSLAAEIQRGLAWLQAQVQADGTVRGEALSIALPMQARAETAVTLGVLGAPVPATLQALLAPTADDPVEWLARKTLAQAQAGLEPGTAQQYLIARQNRDGGFGADSGYPSNPLDTAWALQALAVDPKSADAGAVKRALSWLASAQQTDGHWELTNDGDHVPTTALASRALWLHRQTVPVDAPLDRAEAFLQGRRVGSTWKATFETALALIALLPRHDDTLSFADTLTALRGAQLANGSWDDDPFTTALALRALAIAANPVPNPDLGSIQGRIVDGDSDFPLSGATVVLTGTANRTLITVADGRFQLQGLPAGSYSLAIQFAGYGTLTTFITLSMGEVADFGDLRVLSVPVNPMTGVIRGQVTDAATGQPLPGATVAASGQTIQTGADGRYQLSNVTPGRVTVAASHAGYATTSNSVDLVAGGILLFSPSLALATGSNKAALMGTITDGRTNQPLAGVTVSLSGGTTASIQTTSAGTYYLQPLNVGSLSIQASLAGYDSIRVSTTVSDGAQLRFSPALFPTGTTPPGANQSRITGQVVDAVTRLPFGEVTFRAIYGGLTRTLKTAADGRFSITMSAGSELALNFTHPGYLPTQLSLPITPPLTRQDLGLVPLRPLGLDMLLPDLTIGAVDARTAANDPQTLALSGSLGTTIKNRGAAATPGEFQVLAFTDDNHDGRFNAAEDTTLGETTVAAALAAGATTTVNLPLAGQTAFRDAPILMWVDSAQTVVENSEDNNIAVSNGQCRLAPPVNGNFQPTLKWQWTQEKVMTIPLVAPLTDTNSDQKIDSRDDPRVIFASHTSSVDAGSAILRAADGKTGNLLWSVTDPALRVRASAHPAIGDIDGDGLPEIVSYRIGDGIAAFSNTGALKWKTTYPPNPSNNYNQGGISLADLDGDGKAEILARGHVLNSDGSLRWAVAEPWNAATTLAVDLDLDGVPEVLVHNRAYRTDGTLLWEAAIREVAFAAIGNFDADPFPEIVYAEQGRVTLINHRGEVIWTVYNSDGGRGGPPTVADLDGDGWPEIGVAGRTSYTVFKRDGSVLWSKPTQDFSSAVTGSTVFDFNGDGRAEVVYGDETMLRVYDGPTGNVIFSIPNRSSTATEYPVVADVDNDGHADLLVVADTSPRGLRVFKDLNNAWVATRPLWNQYAYHIDNVLDDLSLPRREVPSWLTHNSYRLNAFPDRHALDTVDLTAGRLRLLDAGANGLSLEARIGNAGPLALTTPTTVAFYQGDPAAGGGRLGAVTLASLGAGRFQDVRLDNVTLNGTADIFAIVDPDNTTVECREDNNRVSAPVASAAARGVIAVATDAATYEANRPVELRATVTNDGRVAHAYQVALRIEDAAGVVVAEFPILPVAALAGGASTTVTQPWNTGDTFAGDYVLHGQLLDPAGAEVAEARAPFRITALAGAAASALRVATDRPDYGPDDRVGLEALARNLSTNRRIEDATVTLEVRGPSGATVFTQRQDLGSLSRQRLATTTARQQLRNAPVGDYTVEGMLRDGQGVEWARARTAYRVVVGDAAGGAPLAGTTTVAHAELRAGAAQTRDDTVRNTGSALLTAVRVARVLAREADGVEVARQEESLTLAAGAEQRWPATPIATASLRLGGHVAVLLAQTDGQWRVLSFATFRVSDAPGGPGGPGGSSPAAIPTLGGPALLGLIALLLAAGWRRSRRLPSVSSTSTHKG